MSVDFVEPESTLFCDLEFGFGLPELVLVAVLWGIMFGHNKC